MARPRLSQEGVMLLILLIMVALAAISISLVLLQRWTCLDSDAKHGLLLFGVMCCFVTLQLYLIYRKFFR